MIVVACCRRAIKAIAIYSVVKEKTDVTKEQDIENIR